MPHPISRTDPADRRPADGARRLGPYETAYDVRRGYDLPRPRERREDVVFFRGREEEPGVEGG